jgi:flagellar basal-body rod modification protein FlgD
MTSAINSTTATQAASSTSSVNNSTDPAAAQDRFLKLLVAQLNNQDPMNPMDNAQMTSQMAQINTVTGIQQVNATLKSMADQFSSMQVMQGASMVGREVLVNGSNVTLNAGLAKGAMNLSGAADSVKVEIVTPGGQVLDTLNLGAQSAGQHSFEWATSSYADRTDLSFRVSASSTGQAVAATTQTQAKVVSANPSSTGLSLGLQGQTTPVAYSDVVSIL